MSKVQGDIGVSIGLSEEELNRGIARVAESLNNLAKTVEKIGKLIDQAMEQATDGAQKAARTTKELAQEEKKAAGAVEEHAQAQKRLTDEQKKASQASRDQKKALEDLKQGLSQISAAAGIASAALAALAKVSGDAYQELQSAFLGLDAVAERTIGDTQAARAAAESLVEDGLMSIAEASKGLQNLLMAGFGLPEAVELMKAFKDAAAFNRQAALGFGEAVVTATEGIKNGNSILVDNAGITKNLSVILQEAGYSAQDLQKVQSDLNVRMALYNGILKEAETFAGNAAKAADTLAGAEARAATEAFNARAAFGEALAPAMQALAEATTDVMGKIGDFVEANPELARTAFLVVGGITAVTAAVGGLSVALLALNTALGPAGWLILGVSAATGAFGGWQAAIETSGREAERIRDRLSELVREYEELRRALGDTTASEEERLQKSERLKQVLEEIRKINPDLVEGTRLQKQALEEYNAELDKSIEKMQRWQAIRAGISIGLRASIALQNPALAPYVAPELFGGQDTSGTEDYNFRDLSTRTLRNRPSDGTGGGGTGSGQGTGQGTGQVTGRSTEDPVRSALRWLEHRLTMEQITPVEYIAGLEEIKRTYSLTAEQLMEIDERIYRTRKQLTEQEIRDAEAARKAKVDEALKLLDHDRAMGWLTTEEEIRRLNEILQTYELTADERMAIEEQLMAAVRRSIAERERAEKEAAEEAAKAEEERVRSAIALINHRKAMGELALEEEIAALEEHLQKEKAYYEQHIDELWAIEERLYRLREQARQEELAKMRQMAEEQKRFLQAVAEADLRALREQFERQERLIERRIERLRAEKEAAEEAAQARIRALQDELDALERLWAAEDRRNRLQELRAELAEVMADTRFQKVDPITGELVWTYDEARARELQQQIAEAEREDERARIRERLQDQIQAERDRLDALRRSYDEEIRYEQERLARLREAHQQELADRQAFWDQVLSMETEQLAALAEAAQQGMDAYVAVFQSTLATVRAEWSATAAAAEAAAARIQAALAEISSAQAQIDSMRLVTPELPASIKDSTRAGTTNATAQVSITINGAADAQTATAVKTAAKQGTEQGLLSALVQAGQTRLRTGG